MSFDSEPKENKLTVCSGCGLPAYCTKESDGWFCNTCLDKEDETADWDDMLIEDAEEDGLI